MKNLVAVLIVLFCFGCTSVVQLNTSPSSGTGAESTPVVGPNGVTGVSLFPGAVTVAVGQEVRVSVVTQLGALEVIAPFEASTEDNTIAVVLAPTGSSTIDRQVIIEGRKVGDTKVVVRSGSASASADVKVVAAEVS